MLPGDLQGEAAGEAAGGEAGWLLFACKVIWVLDTSLCLGLFLLRGVATGVSLGFPRQSERPPWLPGIMLCNKEEKLGGREFQRNYQESTALSSYSFSSLSVSASDPRSMSSSSEPLGSELSHTEIEPVSPRFPDKTRRV